MTPGVGAASKELPRHRKCAECEAHEARRAVEVCRECGSGYCDSHAEAHRRKCLSHHPAKHSPGAQAATSRAGGEGPRKEEVGAQAEPLGKVESETEDSESEEESKTEESGDHSDAESEEDSEEEQESESEEDNQGGESVAGETEAESRFDREIKVDAERVSKRKCPDHGLDLSTYCQKDGPLICVLGAHQDYRLYTPDEALEELKSIDSSRVKEAFRDLVEKLKVKSSDPTVTGDQMKVFLQEEFRKVQKVVADEEQKPVHLVDILNVMDTAHLPEILAGIQSRTDRQKTQMAQAKEELNTANESAEPKAECASDASEEENT